MYNYILPNSKDSIGCHQALAGGGLGADEVT